MRALSMEEICGLMSRVRRFSSRLPNVSAGIAGFLFFFAGYFHMAGAQEDIC